NAGFEFLHFRSAAIGVKTPLGVLGSRSSDIFTRGSFASLHRTDLRRAHSGVSGPLWPRTAAFSLDVVWRRSGWDSPGRPVFRTWFAGHGPDRLQPHSGAHTGGGHRYSDRPALVPAGRVAQLPLPDPGDGFCLLVSILEPVELQPRCCGKLGIPSLDS